MYLFEMPLSDLFLPIIQENTIQNWTANNFWIKLDLPKNERHSTNRQRMYRILMKLVEFGFLEKRVNPTNHRFSRFTETQKMLEFKSLDESKIDLSNMQLEEDKINLEIIFLEKQNEKYVELEKTFPNLQHKIFDEKEKCSFKILELKAYRSALKSIIDKN